ncbi:glycosyltransferase [Paenibacillus sp. 2TAB19]
MLSKDTRECFFIMADVGIVMPVYTQDSMLFRQAIRSILKQTYRNIKLIIVIDGVTPNVLRIARNFARRDARVQVIPRPQNQGTDTALNVGFNVLKQMRSIKYLTWVSSDNYYYPNCIRILRRNLKNAPPNVGFVHSSFRFVMHYQRVPVDVEKMKGYIQWQSQQTKEKLLETYFIGYAFLYKKSYAKQVGEYRFTPVEDYDYFLRLTEVSDMIFVPRILMDFRVRSPHSNSLELRNSKKKYYLKRYLLNLCVQEARARRNIPYETSVIFPVQDASEETLHRLDSLLEQVYLNQKIYLLDLTPDTSAMPVLGEMPDPRIDYIAYPGLSYVEAINRGLELVQTPYVVFYGRGDYSAEIDYFEETIKLIRQMVHVPYARPIQSLAEISFQTFYRNSR